MKEINVAMMMVQNSQNQASKRDSTEEAKSFIISEETGEDLLNLYHNDKDKSTNNKFGHFIIPEVDIKAYN